MRSPPISPAPETESQSRPHLDALTRQQVHVPPPAPRSRWSQIIFFLHFRTDPSARTQTVRSGSDPTDPNCGAHIFHPNSSGRRGGNFGNSRPRYTTALRSPKWYLGCTPTTHSGFSLDTLRGQVPVHTHPDPMGDHQHHACTTHITAHLPNRSQSRPSAATQRSVLVPVLGHLSARCAVSLLEFFDTKTRRSGFRFLPCIGTMAWIIRVFKILATSSSLRPIGTLFPAAHSKIHLTTSADHDFPVASSAPGFFLPPRARGYLPRPSPHTHAHFIHIFLFFIITSCLWRCTSMCRIGKIGT